MMKCDHCEKGWGTEDLTDMSGKTIIVTGGNSGIGFYTALALGKAGAEVIIACRDKAKGNEALSKLQNLAPYANFAIEILDLSNESSIAEFAKQFLAQNKALDILVNNAGVMAPPQRESNDKGFEIQFATNHLGHFALTGLLLPALKKSSKPRVEIVSSLFAFLGKINFDDLQCTENYYPMIAYAQSKLANLFFIVELGKKAPWLKCTASHPGTSVTNLQKYSKFSQFVVGIIGQKPQNAALPTLRACSEDVESGTFYGPKGFLQLKGAPIIRSLPSSTKNVYEREKLWSISEELSNVRYDFT